MFTWKIARTVMVAGPLGECWLSSHAWGSPYHREGECSVLEPGSPRAGLMAARPAWWLTRDKERTIRGFEDSDVY